MRHAKKEAKVAEHASPRQVKVEKLIDSNEDYERDEQGGFEVAPQFTHCDDYIENIKFFSELLSLWINKGSDNSAPEDRDCVCN